MDRSWYRIALRGVSRASSARSLAIIGAALGVFLSTSAPVMAQSVCDQTGGTAPTATGGSAFACGDGATAAGGLGTAFGTDSAAGGGNSVAVGGIANASGDFSSAIGRSAAASATAATAVGFNSAASGENSMSFGANSAASAANAHAFGTGAVASGADSTAIGNAASATAANSVALGAGSVAGEDNTVSVGAAGAERKVTNVAAGVNDTDAVNVSQLNDTAATTLAAANTYTDQQINQIGGLANSAAADLAQFKAEANDRFVGIDDRLNGMDESLRNMDRRISRQAAMATAQVHSLGSPEAEGESWFGVGVGRSEGSNAVAVGFRHRFTKGFSASAGVSKSSGESSVGGGVGFTW